MAITGTTTQDEAITQYLENVGYDINGSIASCKLFIEACRALLALMPAKWSKTTSNFEYDPALWRASATEALAWLSENQTGAGGSVKHIAFGENWR